MQGEDLEEVVPPVKAPTKGGKKPFGHHSGKPGVPFCTMEGMGQVSVGSNGITHTLSAFVAWQPLLCTLLLSWSPRCRKSCGPRAPEIHCLQQHLKPPLQFAQAFLMMWYQYPCHSYMTSTQRSQ